MRSRGTPSVRRFVIVVTIGSFSLAALMGITALLVPGQFGAAQGRVLLTTVVVGVTSVLAICYLSVGATRQRWLGWIGGAAATVSAISLLDIIWAHWDDDAGPALLRTFGVSAIIALTLAQFSLLVVVHGSGTVARILRLTLAAGTALAALLIAAVLGWDPGDGAARGIGVIAILDVLGSVVTIVLGVFGGGRRTAARGLTVVVPAPLAARVRERAETSGRSPTDLVLDAIAHYVEAAPGRDHPRAG